MAKYNGWKNRETWNVALWIGNDEGLYNAARQFMSHNFTIDEPYQTFINEMELESECTPDGVHWMDSGLDHDALDEMMRELVS